MIYTVTLNPSVDYLVRVPDFQLGATNRAESQEMVPGGKGINVSKVLSTFDVATRLYGFTAGFTGDFIEKDLKEKSLETHFIHVQGTTRINVKLRTDTETEVNGQSPDISDKNTEELLAQIDQLTSGDTLVLSGSLPSNLPADFYETIIRTANQKKVRTILDTSGAPLTHGLKANPFLIKPNIAELEALYQTTTAGIEEVIELAERAVSDGAENVLVSSGGKPALLVSKDMVLESTIPSGSVVNSVGAGDSMVAGFLYSLSKNSDLKQAFQYSVAFGSATAFSQGFVTAASFHNVLPEVQINTLTHRGDLQ